MVELMNESLLVGQVLRALADSGRAGAHEEAFVRWVLRDAAPQDARSMLVACDPLSRSRVAAAVLASGVDSGLASTVAAFCDREVFASWWTSLSQREREQLLPLYPADLPVWWPFLGERRRSELVASGGASAVPAALVADVVCRWELPQSPAAAKAVATRAAELVGLVPHERLAWGLILSGLGSAEVWGSRAAAAAETPLGQDGVGWLSAGVRALPRRSGAEGWEYVAAVLERDRAGADEVLAAAAWATGVSHGVPWRETVRVLAASDPSSAALALESLPSPLLRFAAADLAAEGGVRLVFAAVCGMESTLITVADGLRGFDEAVAMAAAAVVDGSAGWRAAAFMVRVAGVDTVADVVVGAPAVKAVAALASAPQLVGPVFDRLALDDADVETFLALSCGWEGSLSDLAAVARHNRIR